MKLKSLFLSLSAKKTIHVKVECKYCTPNSPHKFKIFSFPTKEYSFLQKSISFQCANTIITRSKVALHISVLLSALQVRQHSVVSCSVITAKLNHVILQI
mmetsp:Transcript_15546/g.22981  ORF Transcript_15546/g.22981 Transcript_15546/m.22981 type:complete len:100 (-) Transcript_15546:117-416(-)